MNFPKEGWMDRGIQEAAGKAVVPMAVIVTVLYVKLSTWSFRYHDLWHRQVLTGSL